MARFLIKFTSPFSTTLWEDCTVVHLHLWIHFVRFFCNINHRYYSWVQNLKISSCIEFSQPKSFQLEGTPVHNSKWSCIRLYFRSWIEIAKTCCKCLRKHIKSVQKVFGSYLRWAKAWVDQAPKATCSQNVNPLFVGNCQAQQTCTTNQDCLTFHRRLLTLINLPACFFAGKRTQIS